MNNKEIARIFNLLGKVMDFHGENPFKIRSYTSAYNTIRRFADPITNLTRQELLEIQGIGRAIADKIIELKETGELRTLNKYLDITPPGIVELLQIKGLGPKKVRTIHQELEVETPGELLYACLENRLVDLKGFGEKTQDAIRQQIAYYLDGKGKFLFGHIYPDAEDLMEWISKQELAGEVSFSGEFRRKMPVVEGIEILSSVDRMVFEKILIGNSEFTMQDDSLLFRDIPLLISYVSPDSYHEALFNSSGSKEFVGYWNKVHSETSDVNEETRFSHVGLPFIPPESRENPEIINQLQGIDSLDLIENDAIRGVVHAHSTYSDGTGSLEDMAKACIERGFEYLVISDHSKAAFYANGLTEDRVLMQMEEIDRLNETMKPFHIFKGIECDILSDGSLDYSEDILALFDVVIASVHTNLRMDKEKATARLLSAIQNPFTKILGHPTGRLLLSREGYPIDHEQIIDACAANGVSIEINASPYRLDLDWTWIEYAQQRDVLLSINPDAHSIEGIDDIRFGVFAARKGLLDRDHCLNAKSLDSFRLWIDNA